MASDGKMTMETSRGKHRQEINYESDYKAGQSQHCACNYTSICAHCHRHMDCGVTHLWIIAWLCIEAVIARHNYSVYNMTECKVRNM